MQFVKPNKPRYVEPPCGDAVFLWHGYYAPPERNFYTMSQLERMAFLGIVSGYANQHVRLVECGAGWAEWCLTLAACVNLELIDNTPASFYGIAIEADLTHWKWAHWATRGLPIKVVRAAVSRMDGELEFRSKADPVWHFGARIAKHGEEGDDVYTVPAVTLNTIIDDYVEIVHMDIQGAEGDAVYAAPLDKIEHFIIETHNNPVEEELRKMLSPTHKALLDLSRYGRYDDVLEYPVFTEDGGIQVWRRR